MFGLLSRKPLLGRIAVVLIVLALVMVISAAAYPPLRHPLRLASLLSDTMPTHLSVPVSGVRSGQLTDTWGAPRGRSRRHQGIDIFAPRNTPVKSVTRGIVLRKGWDQLGGRVMGVMGPGGYYHYYAHLQQQGSQEPGDMVEQGDTIGYVGDSGNANGTPTHLHYGIYRPLGRAIDPYPLLK